MAFRIWRDLSNPVRTPIVKGSLAFVKTLYYPL